MEAEANAQSLDALLHHKAVSQIRMSSANLGQDVFGTEERESAQSKDALLRHVAQHPEMGIALAHQGHDVVGTEVEKSAPSKNAGGIQLVVSPL